MRYSRACVRGAISAGVAPLSPATNVSPGEALKAEVGHRGRPTLPALGALALHRSTVSFVLSLRRTLSADVRLARPYRLASCPSRWGRAVNLSRVHSAGGARCASRASSRRGVGDPRREVGIRFCQASADRRRVVHQQHGGRGRRSHASRGPPETRVAQRHHTGLVRHDGHSVSKRARFHPPRSCRQSARGHRQRASRAGICPACSRSDRRCGWIPTPGRATKSLGWLLMPCTQHRETACCH